ncbi:alpha/beta hydrolase [bacterium]|nr:alpha/beta hydrolase [bacterium]
MKVILLIAVLLNQVVSAVDHRDVPYRSGDELDAYTKEKCVLDLHLPDKKNFATVIWFHGGGLTGGKKSIPKELQDQGFAVVAPSYRLTPKVKSGTCVADAAAAVAWVFENIEKHGGAREKIFISGHSAGGYLTSMVGLDSKWLKVHGIETSEIAGLIPYSGHTITHFAVRKERGITDTTPIIDEMAPLFHVRKNAPPMLLITGDRDKEMLGRYEENAYFWRMMQEVKHHDCELFELEGFDHGGMATPAHGLLVKWVREKT